MTTIDFYRQQDDYGELSNFWILEEPIVYRKWTFPSSEHLYHALKFMYTGAPKQNKIMIDLISGSTTPYKSKLVSAYCQKSQESQKSPKTPQFVWQQVLYKQAQKAYKKGARINPNLDSVKLKIMRKALIEKFSVSEKASSVLLSTGDAILRESSVHDSFWGIGKDGKGKNWLGKLLMEIRDT